MLQTTYEATKGLLKADPSVSPKERARILNLLRQQDESPASESKEPPRILRREETAIRLGEVSLRTIDLWAEQGILTKIRLPGRKRACGFSSIEVDRLAKGEIR